ncbi:enoyl-CoA hydratase/isomerase family protein [Streptomyces johnsoniae]|uniref:Enoyl-CoA hydratase/isomerase family protein n=1 Tax=Streptomyces johnsoniae TaxID=3075532 RepID=A0ABU2S806_9ACTN|nr:enoyl-CoA hydratase/isomerase family protein [Streptomyces sp. DSM 41886]MDT0444544.1 enoyl-CoA hydratase/isomerase family protein [Streptomyces sp. DSM 41886]
MRPGAGTHPEFRSLLVSRDGHVVQVRLNTPESGNAVTEELLAELLTVLTAVRDDPGIRVLVLSGAGADFSLGGDLGEYDALMAQDPTGGRITALGAKARDVCDALAGSSAVTIARLHGRVVGAGLALSLFCDLRAGTDTTRFRMPELAVGLPIAWGGALPRLVQEAGAARVRELLLLGSSFDAAAAWQMSILHRVAAEHELDGVIQEWIRPLVRRSPVALRVTKSVLNSYAAASRIADASILEGDLLAAALGARRHERGGG